MIQFCHTWWILLHPHTIGFFVGNVATRNDEQSRTKAILFSGWEKYKPVHYLQDDSKCLWIESIVMIIHYVWPRWDYVSEKGEWRACHCRQIHSSMHSLFLRFSRNIGCGEKVLNNIKFLVQIRPNNNNCNEYSFVVFARAITTIDIGNIGDWVSPNIQISGQLCWLCQLESRDYLDPL